MAEQETVRRKERIRSDNSEVAGCDERLAAATSAESVWGSLGVGSCRRLSQLARGVCAGRVGKLVTGGISRSIGTRLSNRYR